MSGVTGVTGVTGATLRWEKVTTPTTDGHFPQKNSNYRNFIFGAQPREYRRYRNFGMAFFQNYDTFLSMVNHQNIVVIVAFPNTYIASYDTYDTYDIS